MNEDPDIVIIGGGMAGLCAAFVLGKQGISTRVIDRSEQCRPCFKAEKLEPFQSRLLGEFGLLDERRPLSNPIEEIILVEGQHRKIVSVGDEYGIRYHETVNRLREVVPEFANIQIGKAKGIEASANRPVVRLVGGSSIRPRLVIIASGDNTQLIRDLGMTRPPDRKALVSLSFGFDLEREDGRPFDFNGFNFRSSRPSDRVSYITLFQVGPDMRANLFTHWSPGDPEVKNFRNEPLKTMARLFPGIEEYIGAVRIRGKLKSGVTRYHRLENVIKPGVLVIGDAYQSVSPATGTGLDKVLADVDVLRRHVPDWLASDGMGEEKIARFYRDPFKRRVDDRSRAEWVHSTNQSRHPASARARRYMWRLGQVLGGRFSMHLE